MKMTGLVVAAFLTMCSVSAEFVVINITNGQIQGSLKSTIPEGNRYYAFKGIRYAQPPNRFEVQCSDFKENTWLWASSLPIMLATYIIGGPTVYSGFRTTGEINLLRTREESIPVKNWKGIYDATIDKAICIQVMATLQDESEDCLYLSVYTPKLPEKGAGSIPVMFWIHGGSFLNGDSLYASFGPDYLLDNNVVVVTINYRLNLLGFLSTGDKRIPGNNGIKDLILGLKWVQKNIKMFGGDPNQVTIFGQSAGAALVSYLLLSPLVLGKGYFHRAITQSGNNLAQWSLQRDPVAVYQHVVEATFCNFLQPLGDDEVLKCLKTVPLVSIKAAIEAVAGLQTLLKLNILNGIDFGPVYEKPSPTAAVTNLAYETLAKTQIAKVPLITGIVSEEGLGFIDLFQIIRPILVQIELNSRILVPLDMYASESDIKKFVAPTIKDYYFTKGPAVLTADTKIMRYVSDVEFNKSFREFLTLIANQTTQYCYVFSYSSALNGQYNYTGLGHVGHEGDLGYLFRRKVNKNIVITAQDRFIIKRFTKLWTNFAKYGNPTPTNSDSVLQNISWPTAWIGRDNVNCLDIGQDLKIVRNPKQQAYQMWKKLYDTYGHPRDTYK